MNNQKASGPSKKDILYLITGASLAFVAMVSLIMLVSSALVSISGCKTHNDEPFVDEFPPQIATQCAQAKAQAVQWGQKHNEAIPTYGVHVIAVEGQRWVTSGGNVQWAIKQGGTLVGGYTMGGTIHIGRGPNWEINKGDLLHEMKEYVSRCNGDAHKF
jgi:hypothetical protein